MSKSKSAFAAAALRDKRAQGKKRLRKRAMWGGGGLVATVIVYLLFVPYTGDMRFGVCRTLLELHAPAPTTLRLTGLDDHGQTVRIWYTHRNAYGKVQMESATCTFGPDPAAPEGFSVAKARVGSAEMGAAALEPFNRTLIAVYAGGPDLVLPMPLPDALEDMQIDPTRYYRRIF